MRKAGLRRKSIVMKAVGIIKDKDFWKKTLLIGIPIALQELLSTGLNLVDTLMLSSMGDATVAATGLANKIFFIFTIFIFSILGEEGCREYKKSFRHIHIDRHRSLAVIFASFGNCSANGDADTDT